ncbi:hypothetical protein [Burkholderia ubonensis]|uniref:hypothetical protein n=1 Tax=Burkholderia ubonensis TaxID=101571 RepID=UPI000A5436AD|nr:hypothetical protein [Burkholderia ubonensis]
MSSSLDARRERLTRRRVVTIAVVAALALLSWRVLSPRDPKPRDVQAPPGTSHITIALTDLYMPFLTPAGKCRPAQPAAGPRRSRRALRAHHHPIPPVLVQPGPGLPA